MHRFVHVGIVDAWCGTVRIATMATVDHLLTIEAAQRAVSEHVSPGRAVSVPLGEAIGRVLAKPIVCDVDYPPFDKAMMDGYAVRAADVAETPAVLRIVGQVAAGHEAAKRVGAGEAIQINTGAPLPPGADAVVPVENTECVQDGSAVSVSVAVPAGKHIDPAAKYVLAGSTVLSPGVRMGPAQIASAAAAGAAEISIYARPSVAILVTGDELVDVDAQPRGAQIRNSNGPMLRSLVTQAGGEVVDLGVVCDDKSALTDRIREGLASDVLCISGGISMGAFDFVPEVLASCGVRIVFRKLAIKPGKPVLFGIGERGTRVFGLPGNPSSGFVCFRLLVRPALATLSGRDERRPVEIAARLIGDCPATKDRQGYSPARIAIDGDGSVTVEHLSWHGSGDPFGLSCANGLIVRPPGLPKAVGGDTVSVIPLEWF